MGAVEVQTSQLGAIPASNANLGMGAVEVQTSQLGAILASNANLGMGAGEVQTSQLGAIAASNANLGMGLEKYRRVNSVLYQRVTPTWVWGWRSTDESTGCYISE